MHEVLIVMLFIQKHGEPVAQRYLDYDKVQTWLNVVEYRKHADALGQPPLTQDHIEDVEREYDAALAQYGDHFKRDYGWAYDALDEESRKPGKVGIKTLEQDVELAARRPYYSLASNDIHPNVKGVDSNPLANLFPTMHGLHVAGHAALAQLADCTNIMTSLRLTPDTERLEQELTHWVADAGRVFLAIQQDLERDEGATK